MNVPVPDAMPVLRFVCVMPLPLIRKKVNLLSPGRQSPGGPLPGRVLVLRELCSPVRKKRGNHIEPASHSEGPLEAKKDRGALQTVRRNCQPRAIFPCEREVILFSTSNSFPYECSGIPGCGSSIIDSSYATGRNWEEQNAWGNAHGNGSK
jgi:hypothetical protein